MHRENTYSIELKRTSKNGMKVRQQESWKKKEETDGRGRRKQEKGRRKNKKEEGNWKQMSEQQYSCLDPTVSVWSLVNGINHKQIILFLSNPRLAILLEEVLKDLMAAETIMVAES